MTDTQILNLLPQLSLSVALVALGALLVLRLPSILDGIKRVQETYNDGRRQDIAAQAGVIAAGTEAVRIAVGAMKETQAQWSKDNEEQRARTRHLENRVEILEQQGEDKDRVIQQQGAEIQRLTEENKKLKEELEEVKKELDAKAKTKKKLMQGDGDGNRAGVRSSGK